MQQKFIRMFDIAHIPQQHLCSCDRQQSSFFKIILPYYTMTDRNYSMHLKNGDSLSSIAESVDLSEPQPPKNTIKRFQTRPQLSFIDLQPFKMLYKCIHPESAVQNSSKVSSDGVYIKKTSIMTEQYLKPEEKENQTLEINNIRSACLTRMGLRNYDGMENQDVIMQDQISNKCKIFGIFDGHGQYGKVIAQAARNIFKNLLQKYSEQIKNENSILSIQNIIKKVLEKTNSYILHYRVEEAQFSGTTALIVLITSQKIYTFNIGNSRAVLGKYYSKKDKIEPFQITHDHTIARFDERARILKSGGSISPFKNEKGEQLGPQRIWVKNQSYPGMFVTRTLGLSCAYKIGVHSQPEMSIIQYKSCYKYLILASDGFWTVEENDQAVNFIEQGYKGQLEGLLNSLMSEAVKRWSNRNVLMDDISLIVISFQ